MKRGSKFFILCLIFVFCVPLYARSQEEKYSIKILDGNFNKINEISSLPDFKGEFGLTTIDLGNDGISELVLAQGRNGGPYVTILRNDGSQINQFLAYAKDYKKGFKVVSCDLDSDSKMEIIVAAGIGGGPQIRVFDTFGNLKDKASFFAFDKNERGGVSVACGDINGDKKNEIIAGSGLNLKAELKVFDMQGNLVSANLPEMKIFEEGQLNLAAGDLDSDGIDEVLVAGGKNNLSKIAILKNNVSEVKIIDAFGGNLENGVNVAVYDYDNNKSNEIVASAQYGGGPQVQVFNGDGRLLSQYFAFDENLRSGVLTAPIKLDSSGKQSIVAVPEKTVFAGRDDAYKYIEIDISEQRLKQWEDDTILNTFVVSTGTYKTPTPKGEFNITDKSPRAYSAAFDLYMPWWMGFYRGNGLHELPEWPNGYKEGANHLGQRASHGCVRLGVGPAKILYDWADVGTLVWVHD